MGFVPAAAGEGVLLVEREVQQRVVQGNVCNERRTTFCASASVILTAWADGWFGWVGLPVSWAAIATGHTTISKANTAINGNDKVNVKRFMTFLLLSFVFRVQGSGFWVQDSRFRGQTTDGDNWRMKHPYYPLFSVLRHLVAGT